MKQARAGFTIVEIVITMTIIVIVASIATPYFLKYRENSCKNACICNMVKIEAAVIMAKMAGISAPTSTELIGPKNYIKSMPACPINHAPYTTIDPPQCPAGEASHVIPPKDA